MRRLLNKTKRRQLEIVEYLQHSKGWVELAEIADQMATSVRTVRSDLKSLERQFTSLTFTIEDRGVRLHFAEGANLLSVHSQILKENTAFQILEYIILNDGVQLEEVVDHFFVSESTMYRQLNRIEKVLRDYFGVALGMTPLSLCGDETNVRFLYLQYYLERYSLYQWPFDKYSEPLVEELVYKITENLHVQLDYITLRKIKLLTVINAKRIKRGHCMAVDESNHQTPLKSLEETPRIKHLVQKLTGQTYQISWLYELSFPYTKADFATNYVDLLAKTTRSEKIRSFFSAFSTLLDQVTAQFELYLSNKEEVLLNLYNTLVFEGITTTVTHFIYNYQEELLSAFADRFNKFYQTLSEEFQRVNYIYDFDLSNEEIYLLVYTTLTTWRNLITLLTDNVPTVDLVVISRFSTDHSRMLADMLRMHLMPNVTLEVYQGNSVSLETLETLACDLLVVNFSVPRLKNKRVVAVDSFITQEDLGNIHRVIQEIVQDQGSYSK